MTFVLDASVTLAWVFEDERSPLSESFLGRLADEGALVPEVWPLEVTNGLLVAERRSRLARSDTARFLAMLDALAIEVDPGTARSAFTSTLDLARAYDISTYDAAYLELAMRRGVALATLDGRLQRAADEAGLPGF